MACNLQELIKQLGNEQADSIDSVTKVKSCFDHFNSANETKFNFDSILNEQQETFTHLLCVYLGGSLTYLNRIESDGVEVDKEVYPLTAAYYDMGCSCLNTIRILSRDTDTIKAFHNDKLLNLIQEAADLKHEQSNQSVAGKKHLSLSEAQLVIETRNRSLLILTSLKSMSNLIFNSKYAQQFYAGNNAAQQISMFLNQFSPMGSISPLYLNQAEADIILFNLKVLFLMTIFAKELCGKVNQNFQLVNDLTEIMRNILTQNKCLNECDTNLIAQILKLLYNLTMDLEGVRSFARDTLSSIQPTDKDFINSSSIQQADLAVLRRLVAVLKDLIVTTNREIQSNVINLLTNIPAGCYEDFLGSPADFKQVTSILDFLSVNMKSYLSSESSADLLYPVLMLLAIMAKSNTQMRHYLRGEVLPPLKKKDLVNLPQHGDSVKNRLVKLMTDPNLQLKRLCAQFLFILCKESVSRLVKYTGYGNAAGLLAEAGLMLSSHGDRAAYSSDSNDSDTEDFKQCENRINLITGQAELDDCDGTELMNELERENMKKRRMHQDLFDGMTEEQKEYEAMQLVNAIDKLTRLGTGIIKPATIGPDGRPCELEHVLQLQEKQ